MDIAPAHLVHTEVLAPIESKASGALSRSGVPSARYQRHLSEQRTPREPRPAPAARPLTVQFVERWQGVAVERIGGNGQRVANQVPFAAEEIDALNVEMSRATDGAVWAQKVNREVRAILMSRMLFAKSRANTRERSFSLTIEGLCALYDAQRGLCAVSGLPMDVGMPAGGSSKWRKPFRVSLDRIDSAGGYEPENVRLVCAAVNNALGAWGEGVFAVLAAAFLSNRRPLSSAVERRVHIADVVGSIPTVATDAA